MLQIILHTYWNLKSEHVIIKTSHAKWHLNTPKISWNSIKVTITILIPWDIKILSLQILSFYLAIFLTSLFPKIFSFIFRYKLAISSAVQALPHWLPLFTCTHLQQLPRNNPSFRKHCVGVNYQNCLPIQEGISHLLGYCPVLLYTHVGSLPLSSLTL